MSKELLIVSSALIILSGLFFLSNRSTAYNQHSTHPALTTEVAQLFNAKNTKKENNLTKEQINWLKQGSTEEDEPARWINHFYDPIHKTAWSGKHYGNLNQQTGYLRGADIAPKPALPSIEWVTNQEYQSAYGRQFGNQTWQKAIKSYIDGDKKSAFVALGHILHLVEDMTVPDHVRDDSHPGIEGDPGSPYEAYSKSETDTNVLLTAENLIKNNQELQNFSNIQDNVYLVKLTKIGHENFFTTRDPYFVLPSYRDHLFPKAVSSGAGVLKLFFNEVEKYKQNPSALEPILADRNTPIAVALMEAPKRNLIKVCEKLDGKCEDVEQIYSAHKDPINSSAKAFASAVLPPYLNQINQISVPAVKIPGKSYSEQYYWMTHQSAKNQIPLHPSLHKQAKVRLNNLTFASNTFDGINNGVYSRQYHPTPVLNTKDAVFTDTDCSYYPGVGVWKMASSTGEGEN